MRCTLSTGLKELYCLLLELFPAGWLCFTHETLLLFLEHLSLLPSSKFGAIPFWFPSRSFSYGVPLMYLSLSADTPERSAILINKKHT